MGHQRNGAPLPSDDQQNWYRNLTTKQVRTRTASLASLNRFDYFTEPLRLLHWTASLWRTCPRFLCGTESLFSLGVLPVHGERLALWSSTQRWRLYGRETTEYPI